MPQQILTQEAVEQTLEERLQEELVYRDAFRGLDAQDVNSNVIKVPNPADVMAEPAAVEPGASYPSTREEYEKISIEREKFGEIIAVPEEDIMDNIFDLVADHVDLAAREMAEFLDGLAFNELTGNVNGTGAGDSDGNLTFDDIVDGMRVAEEADADPDVVYVGPQGKADLMTSADFTRATDLGDETITQGGTIGTVAGLEVRYSNTGDIATSDAFVVDTDVYGYEATFTPVQTEEDEDFDTDTRRFKIKTRKGFKAIKPEAAVQVDG